MDLSLLLETAGVDSLLVTADSGRDPDLAAFVGNAHLGRCFVLAANGGVRLGYFTAMERDEASGTGLELETPADLAVPAAVRESSGEADLWVRVLRRALERGGGPRLALAGRIGAGTAAAIATALAEDGHQVCDGREICLLARKRKDATELAEVRQTAHGLAAALRRVAGLLAAAEIRDGELWAGPERLRVGRLRAEVALALARHGLEQPHGNIVAVGADAGIPHSSGRDEEVPRAGAPVLVDLFPRRRLFADCTRTFCVGPVPGALRRGHEVVLAALRLAAAAARPGGAAADLHTAVCGHFERAGYPTPATEPESERGYVHNLGHGVGYELHEYPTFRAVEGQAGTLEVGDLMTLEPGLYEPGEGWGVRLEDLCVMGTGELENLTPLPYALDPREWAER